MSRGFDRTTLVAASGSRPNPPYGLDPELTFYCPQENLEALDLPVVSSFLDWAENCYKPPAVKGPAVLLLLPCQKVKPYALSPEHRSINAALIGAGYRPQGRGDWPQELGELAADELLSNEPLEGNGLRVDRAVISEPFGFVPYEAMYHWGGELSPCAAYDDPGLFEHRGLACTWRPDCTSIPPQAGRIWRWGDNERAAYVETHNRLAESMAAALGRISGRYEQIIAYVAPKLTHRSFIVDREGRRAVGLANSRRVGGVNRELVGVNDIEPGLVRVVPDPGELAALRDELGGRLPSKLLGHRLSLENLNRAIGSNRG
jgi:hypothetical protein